MVQLLVPFQFHADVLRKRSRNVTTERVVDGERHEVAERSSSEADTVLELGTSSGRTVRVPVFAGTTYVPVLDRMEGTPVGPRELDHRSESFLHSGYLAGANMDNDPFLAATWHLEGSMKEAFSLPVATISETTWSDEARGRARVDAVVRSILVIDGHVHSSRREPVLRNRRPYDAWTFRETLDVPAAVTGEKGALYAPGHFHLLEAGNPDADRPVRGDLDAVRWRFDARLWGFLSTAGRIEIESSRSPWRNFALSDPRKIRHLLEESTVLAMLSRARMDERIDLTEAREAVAAIGETTSRHMDALVRHDPLLAISRKMILPGSMAPYLELDRYLETMPALDRSDASALSMSI